MSAISPWSLKDDVVIFPKHWKPIPKPYYVVRCDGHFLVAELDEYYNLINEKSVIHWNPYTIRRTALKISESK